LVTGTATIAAVSFVAGLLLTNVPGLTGWDPYGLSIGVLVVSGLILLLGHYKALDRLSKLLVALLTLLTGVAACVVADPRPCW
jgi:Mn2+/Fe2+ NRAMP family transporter